MNIEYKNQIYSLDLFTTSKDQVEVIINHESHKLKIDFHKELPPNTSVYIVEHQNQFYKVFITESEDQIYVTINGKNYIFTKKKEETKSFNYTHVHIREIVAPLPGTLTKLYVKKDQVVKQGEILLIIESMKMENQILSPRDAIIEEVYVKEGQKIETNQKLLKLD